MDELLAKWLSNTATEDELAILKKWATQSEENLKLIENLQKTWSEDNSEPLLVNVDAKANEIWASAMKEMPKQARRRYLWIRYAAAILILSCSFFWLLSRADFGQTAQEDVLSIARTYILRENAPGQKTKVNLPDGSIAFLNSSSSIKYSNGFDGAERRIILKGEAFFEVAKDATKPFVVESNNIETIALGTAFNVNAFNLNEIRISLVEGKVRINQAETADEVAILSPGFELVVNTSTQEFLNQPFEYEDVIGWKEGRLVFNHASLEEVSLRLERWYAVDITLKGRVPTNWKISTVYENQPLENVLIDLQYSKKFAYEINGSTVTITF
ncbi:FecR family protein [Algoriphagus resistens]|uniref:FecR family protein n=1 Tax=Algoriphagus resistens TaxID=1750590 RepID=UPI0007169363|nr:FecR family protein [Algoriphagus resistens]